MSDSGGRNNGWSWTCAASITARQTAAERWAALVLRACHADGDPSTVGAWGSAVGACETTIHTTCKALGLSARDSRDFTRVLRALRQKAGSLRDLDALLIVAEPRTWKQFLERAGLDGSPADSLISLDEFLRRQRFVPLDHRALKTLRVWIAKAHA